MSQTSSKKPPISTIAWIAFLVVGYAMVSGIGPAVWTHVQGFIEKTNAVADQGVDHVAAWAGVPSIVLMIFVSGLFGLRQFAPTFYDGMYRQLKGSAYFTLGVVALVFEAVMGLLTTFGGQIRGVLGRASANEGCASTLTDFIQRPMSHSTQKATRQLDRLQVASCPSQSDVSSQQAQAQQMGYNNVRQMLDAINLKQCAITAALTLLIACVGTVGYLHVAHDAFGLYAKNAGPEAQGTIEVVAPTLAPLDVSALAGAEIFQAAPKAEVLPVMAPLGTGFEGSVATASLQK